MGEKRKIGRPATGRDPTLSIRMPVERRHALDEKAKQAGSDRSKVINDLAAWYVSEDDAELPERPEPTEE
jgi:predicted DNA-binding protein